MADFGNLETIKSSRKAHDCEQCGRTIPVGSGYVLSSGRYEGEFYSSAMHEDCFQAANDFADEHGLWGEEWPWFQHGDFEREDKDWVIKNYPEVAKRLLWEPEPDDWEEEDDLPAGPHRNVKLENR